MYNVQFHLQQWERPYQDDSTASRLLSEVKHVRAWLVLRWGTTLESQVLFSFSVTNLALFCPSGCYWPTNCGSLNLELYSLPPAFLFLALFYLLFSRTADEMTTRTPSNRRSRTDSIVRTSSTHSTVQG